MSYIVIILTLCGQPMDSVMIYNNQIVHPVLSLPKSEAPPLLLEIEVAPISGGKCA